MRNNDGMVPFIAGQFSQLRMIVNAFSNNCQISFAAADHLRNGRRAALFDGQIDFRVVFDKFRNDFGQSITRLGMRCRDGQGAAVMIGKLAADIFNVLYITQNPFRNL